MWSPQVLLDSIPHIVWTAGPDGTLAGHNDRWRDFTGLQPEEGWESAVGSLKFLIYIFNLLTSAAEILADINTFKISLRG
jgi:hypothetical protein